MAAIVHKKDYAPMNLGLNTRFFPPTLNDLEVVTGQNAQVNNTGTLEKYPGFIKDGSPFPNSSDSFIRTIFDFRRGSSTDLLLIAAADDGNTNTNFKVDIKSTIGDGNYSYITYGIGTATINNGSTTVTGQNTSWTFELKAGDKIKLAADADSFYAEIATVNSDTSITLTSNYTGSSAATAAYLARKVWNVANVVRITSFNNRAIITDGDRAPQSYDGTNLIGLINSYSGTVITVAANPAPKGKAVISHKNRLFMYVGSTLYWSHVGDQTFWDPASNEPIFQQDGGDIVSIVSFADSIFIFKNNGKIYRAFGNFDDSAIGTIAFLTKVDYSENIGIIADRSTFIHNNTLYFLSETGVYVIDVRGMVQRISYYIEPTTKGFNFSFGAQTSKSFSFLAKTDWNSGTNNGTYPVQAGQIFTFFDDYRQTDALLGNNLCAIAIDTSNTIHIAYVPSSNSKQINYIKYYTTGTVPTAGSNPQKETLIIPNPDGSVINCLSISVDSSSGKVGIAFATTVTYFIERSADNGLVIGTWGTATAIPGLNGENFLAISCQHTGGGVPTLAVTGFSGANSGLWYAQRNSGVWAVNGSFDTQGDSGISTSDFRVSLALDSIANIYISVVHTSPSLIRTWKSTNGGTTFSLVESFSTPTAMPTNSSIQNFVDHLNNFYTVFSGTDNIIRRRNHTGTTTLTIDSTSNSLSRGGLTLARTVSAVTTDYFYYLNVVGTSPNQQEKYIFETSSNDTNPTANVINISNTSRPSDKQLVNNGQTIASIQFGTNTNEIVIRRIAFYAFWVGPEQHDSTLSAWGTYVVTGQISNGNTVQQQIALSSAPGATSFNNINSGSIISSNAALIYNVPKFIVTLAAWAGSQITSIVLNYTGAGVDSRQAFGISFYNEAYFATSQQGQTTNNVVLIQDFKNAYWLATYAVNCLERFKTNLYAGSATNGDLYVLKQGSSFNGSSYNMDVVTKEDFFNTVELVKDFYKTYVLFKVQPSGTFVFSYRFDNFASSVDLPWISQTIDQTKLGIAEVKLGNKTARSIQYRIQNNNNGEMVSILGFSTHFGFLDRR